MSRTVVRPVAVLAPLLLLAAACGDDDGGGGAESRRPPAPLASAEEIDYEALGLWDDGPCDEAKPPLVIGLMTVFESPVVSLEDQAIALEASAEAFNARGGANGSCIEVHTCDDGANARPGGGCVREIDEAGVVATVNDQGTAGQAEVSAAMAAAGIPRIAGNVTNADWDDQNAYPARPVGHRRHVPASRRLLRLAGANKIGLIRVDLPQASALPGLLEDLYEDEGMTFPYDVGVPAGHDRLQPVHPRRPEGRGRGRHPEPRRAGGGPGRAGRPAARHRPADRRSGPGTFSHKAVAELGRLRRADGVRQRLPAGDRSTSPSTRRCGPTWRPRARSAPAGEPARPARCDRGSASTRCCG